MRKKCVRSIRAYNDNITIISNVDTVSETRGGPTPGEEFAKSENITERRPRAQRYIPL